MGRGGRWGVNFSFRLTRAYMWKHVPGCFMSARGGWEVWPPGCRGGAAPGAGWRGGHAAVAAAAAVVYIRGEGK